MKLPIAAALSSLFLIASSGISLAQQNGAPAATAASSGSSDQNLNAIRQTASEFVDAFNRADADAIASLWTVEGEYIDEAGSKYAGRDAIEKGYADFFAANPAAKLNLLVDSVRVVSDTVAIEDGQAVLESPTGGVPTASAYTVVHANVDGRWLMASVRDARVGGVAASENITDLEWLIGSWRAEDRGMTTKSECRWLGDKSFVERRYTTKGADGVETTGVQIIGWNAQAGHVQSWNFSPDGAFAVGIWSPIEGGWQASVSGITAEGVATNAVNRLQRLDDNAYVWQSVQRSLGGASLPNTDEVVMRRTPQK